MTSSRISGNDQIARGFERSRSRRNHCRVGLAQNLAACRALVTEGIQRGHMSLHASNIALAAGASPDELPEVVARLIKDNVVCQDHAEQLLAEMRSEPPGEQ